MAAWGDLDRARIGELHARELARFRDARPRTRAMISRARAHMPNGMPMSWMASDNDQPVYIDHGADPRFTDIDGFAYLDFNASTWRCSAATPIARGPFP
jgi:glutamate-1-semialdehyde 2,1-aminomutase